MSYKSSTLIEDWIELYLLQEKNADIEKTDALFYAFEELDNICRNDPLQALEIINKILNSTESEFVLANLAAGPLEDILVRNGKSVINQIERQANTNPQFQKLLKGVWKNAMSDDIWYRVLVASGREA